MAFTAQELSNINNSTLATYIEKGTVFKQNVSNKPMLKAFDEASGTFTGGNLEVSLGVKSGQGGGSLAGYTHDDQVSYYNPANNKRVHFPWKEHHLGMALTHTELKVDGIDVEESGSAQRTSPMAEREMQALANILDEKNDDLGEDYAKSLDTLIHGDGSADVKALAGIRSFIFDVPNTGTTGGLSRVANSWYANRAATTAYGLAGGQDSVTSATTGGGVFLQLMQKELRLLGRYAQGGVNLKMFAGTDVYDAMEKELRANGNYTQDGFTREGSTDGGMAALYFKKKPVIWDPTLDDLGLSKRLFVIDMRRIKLLYMNGQRMKRHNPARPYDRYTMYNGITMTGVMVAQQLNTSGVYEIK